ALSPDGQLLASAGVGRTVRVWSVADGKEKRLLDHPKGVVAFAFAPTGEYLATLGSDRRLRLWDPAAGTVKRLFELVSPGICLACSPDGKTLAVARETIELLSAETGKFQLAMKGHEEGLLCLAYAPDGKTLASAGDQTIRLWDPATGGMLREWGCKHGITCLSFAPDGKTLACGASDGAIRLFDPSNGNETGQLPGRRGRSCWALTFAADGKTLAASFGNGDATIQRWEVATGKPLAPLKGFQGGAVPVAFHPDSRALAALGDDPLARLWDVANPTQARQAPRIRLTPEEIRDLWAELGSHHVSLAVEACETLTLDPARALEMFEKSLKPVPPLPPIAKLLADLDSSKFNERQAANDLLESIGKAAEGPLREALKNKPSLEVTLRVERLLERIESGKLSAEQLRGVRGIWVLEQLGTPEARRVLEAVARGAPDATLTREAKAAVVRMSRK
ncbi:MAG: WD40 repeat domain-containing protein, partial [Planctomycetia bacterium]|nr:WD40 repeat domain-containing protein [Planctomycetia bacterium]